jgi:hypothetical protein
MPALLEFFNGVAGALSGSKSVILLTIFIGVSKQRRCTLWQRCPSLFPANKSFELTNV